MELQRSKFPWKHGQLAAYRTEAGNILDDPGTSYGARNNKH